MQAFQSVAEYYELLTNRVKRLEREGPFLLDCLNQAPGRRVLDLACGTGLHAEYLAEQGAEVTAVDASEAMIAHARRVRPHPSVTYRVADMRHVEGGPWDLALCLGNSLSLLPTPDDLVSVFKSVHRGLAPGGRFLIQVLNYAAPTLQVPRHRIERATQESTQVIAIKNLVPEGARTLLSLNFFALEGNEVASVTETAVLTHWSPKDLWEAASAAGFQREQAWGAFDGTAFNPGTSSDFLCCYQ